MNLSPEFMIEELRTKHCKKFGKTFVDRYGLDGSENNKPHDPADSITLYKWIEIEKASDGKRHFIMTDEVEFTGTVKEACGVISAKMNNFGNSLIDELVDDDIPF